jgi:glyoxylase-like metal-dependent hydrolase (beta-lactamase superfamily II)
MKEGTSTPRIQCFTLGPFETNCYVVSMPGSRECWIVDASFEPRTLIDWVKAQGLQPRTLLLTHAHVDHIAGASEVVRAFRIEDGPVQQALPIALHEAEAAWLANPMLNLSAMMGMDVTAPGPDELLHDGDQLSLAGSRWNVLHTPGHSPGGVTFYHEESGQALVGDTLFQGSIGRTDFPGSDTQTLLKSIRKRLYALPDETVIYPGHGEPSTIGREKRTNPFVRP